jgi:hypothetical protein
MAGVMDSTSRWSRQLKVEPQVRRDATLNSTGNLESSKFKVEDEPSRVTVSERQQVQVTRGINTTTNIPY